jgi:sporulation protein YlmC with PRC-barrel domain
MASEWKDIVSQAKDLAKRASQATKEELERLSRDIEVALGKATTELEKRGLELRKRIVDGVRASREPLLVGREVITSDGVSLGTVRDIRLDIESKRTWLVVGKAFGEARNIPTDDIKAIGDKIILSLAENDISPEEKKV